MFHPDGRWKEFGTISSEHTVFPFWMFCIVWAIVSYVVVILLGVEGTSTVAVATSAGLLKESEPPEDLVPQLPLKTRKKKNSTIHTEYGNMKPGYYVLDRKGSKEAGVPKYIYVGKPPAESIITSGGDGSDVDSESGDE